jgi:hypothetical protein
MTKGWLDNYNDSTTSAPEGFIGEGIFNGPKFDNPAWGGQFQMGGNLPGAVGNMYARTGSPSKGPRRNQTDVTDASAQNGKEMQYYQQGLDWKPKTISKNGAWLDNYDVAQEGINLPSVRDLITDTMNRKIQERKGKGKETKVTQKDNAKTVTPKIGKVATAKEKEQRAIEENKQAQEASELQARKDWVQGSMEEAYKSPLMSPGYFTPEGMAIGAMQGAVKMGPDLYEGNYKGAAVDALMMLPLAPNAVRAATPLIQKAGRALGTEEGLLSNAYKLNPWAYKSNPEAFYRKIGNEGLDDALESGLIRAKQQPTQSPSGKGVIDISENFQHKDPYFAKGKPLENYKGKYMVEVEDIPMEERAGYPNTSYIPKNILETSNPNLKIYEKDWLQGYKEVPKPTSNFNSEINWGKWNKEIPDNPQLMKEYNAIEQTSKANGSWMKNPDGSSFQGTPEQFVQQNSENFKKAFGNTKVRDAKGNVQITNHSTWDKFDEFDLNKFGQTDDGFYGKGAYFHPNTNSPKLYGDIDMNSYVNIENPMPHETRSFFGREGKGAYWDSAKNEQVIIDDLGSLWKGKYDGYITPHGEYPLNDFNSTEYITNIPSNIKSATGNNGMFDMTNPNIYKAVVPGAIGLGALQQKKDGGVIKDDRGQWDHPGEITEIGSNEITMEGVPYDVLGVSDTGDTKLMKPGKNYKFKGKKVTEYPMAKNGVNQQDQKTLQQLDQLTNFTNYNKPQPGGWLEAYK